MKLPWLIVLFLPIVVVPAQSQQTKLAARQGFTVSLPPSVNPETVEIYAGVYGQGLSMSEVRTEPGVYDYPIDLADSDVGPATALKLLVYIPGYRMVASEFSAAELQTGRVYPSTRPSARCCGDRQPHGFGGKAFTRSSTERALFFDGSDGVLRICRWTRSCPSHR